MPYPKIPEKKPPKAKEEWRFVEGYDNLYSVSNYGRIRANAVVRKNPNGKYSKYSMKKGFKKAVISKDHPSPKVKLTNIYGVSKWHELKYLVAGAWLRKRAPGAKVIWKDGDKTNCSVWNLEEVGLKKAKHANKLTEQEIREIKEELKERGNFRGVKAFLARKYQVSEALIGQIKLGKKWKNFT